MSFVPDDPGLDQHAWRGEYASLEPQLEDDPAGALPELADLVGRMLEERGLMVDDDVGHPSTEEVSVFGTARELAERAARGEELEHGDVAFAIGELRGLYEALLEERRP